jgi:hypothetical protein
VKPSLRRCPTSSLVGGPGGASLRLLTPIDRQ